jgi:PAS domain S-box-containing protein
MRRHVELPTRDEVVAHLTHYQDALDAAHLGGAARYLAAFRESPPGVGVHEIDADTVVLRVNPEELRILGYRESEMVGRPVLEFIVMQEASQRAIEQKMKGSKDLKPFVRTFRRSDGGALPLMLLDRLLKDPRGEVIGLRTVMTEARFRE